MQYPHAIEHDDDLLIAFSRGKKQTELLRVPLDDIDRLRQQARAEASRHKLGS